VGMSDLMWGDVLAMRTQYRMGNELMLAARGREAWFDNFDIMGVGSGPFGFNQNPFIQEVSDSAPTPTVLPPVGPPEQGPTPPPLVFPTPPPPVS